MSRLLHLSLSDSHFDWDENGVGFHGVAKTAQRAGAAQAAPTATAATTVATADGSDATTTQALANVLKTQLNLVIAENVQLRARLVEIQQVLILKGLMKGSA